MIELKIEVEVHDLVEHIINITGNYDLPIYNYAVLGEFDKYAKNLCPFKEGFYTENVEVIYQISKVEVIGLFLPVLDNPYGRGYSINCPSFEDRKAEIIYNIYFDGEQD